MKTLGLSNLFLLRRMRLAELRIKKAEARSKTRNSRAKDQSSQIQEQIGKTTFGLANKYIDDYTKETESLIGWVKSLLPFDSKPARARREAAKAIRQHKQATSNPSVVRRYPARTLNQLKQSMKNPMDESTIMSLDLAQSMMAPYLSHEKELDYNSLYFAIYLSLGIKLNDYFSVVLSRLQTRQTTGLELIEIRALDQLETQIRAMRDSFKTHADRNREQIYLIDQIVDLPNQIDTTNDASTSDQLTLRLECAQTSFRIIRELEHNPATESDLLEINKREIQQTLAQTHIAKIVSLLRTLETETDAKIITELHTKLAASQTQLQEMLPTLKHYNQNNFADNTSQAEDIVETSSVEHPLEYLYACLANPSHLFKPGDTESKLVNLLDATSKLPSSNLTPKIHSLQKELYSALLQQQKKYASLTKTRWSKFKSLIPLTKEYRARNELYKSISEFKQLQFQIELAEKSRKKLPIQNAEETPPTASKDILHHTHLVKLFFKPEANAAQKIAPKLNNDADAKLISTLTRSKSDASSLSAEDSDAKSQASCELERTEIRLMRAGEYTATAVNTI